MLSQEQIDKVRQTKMDALAAKYLHEERLKRLDWLNPLVDVLAVAVPVLYGAFRLLAKGTEYSDFFEHSWEILAALLVVAVVVKLVFKWQDKSEGHRRMMAENIVLAGQADYLLGKATTASGENAIYFFRMAELLEKNDREILGTIKDVERQSAYRKALKELTPGSVSTKCPKCNASPWDFTPGSCQLCGNTPLTGS